MSGPHVGERPRCDEAIRDYRDAVRRHGVWAHRGCVAGADETNVGDERERR